jgi:hypothetical protein
VATIAAARGLHGGIYNRFPHGNQERFGFIAF